MKILVPTEVSRRELSQKMSERKFADRHIGPNKEQIQEMLGVVGYESLDALTGDAVPKSIRLKGKLDLPAELSENLALEELRELAKKNVVTRSYIGTGYHGTVTPPVIQRNILENPGWYTQYTPYQSEISQGRLEALLNFQTMVSDLTGMELANASLLDEATAAAEAMSFARAVVGGRRRKILVSQDVHPQTIAVVQTRAEPLEVDVQVGHPEKFEVDDSVFAVLLQYPNTFGEIHDYGQLVEKAHAHKALVCVAADLLSLTLLKPPGEWGADVVVGNTQRFGVPMGYGGPHAAFFATRMDFKRLIPGRLVGLSKDKDGAPAVRLALQTREQHIRREKATSNICTAQVLLAVIAAMYATYHGPSGLRQIATRVRRRAWELAQGLRELGFEVGQSEYFDTICVSAGRDQEKILQAAWAERINLRPLDSGRIGMSVDETTEAKDIAQLLGVFSKKARLPKGEPPTLSKKFARTSEYLTHPTFHRYQSETELLRYMKSLENKDLSLTGSMIPLGSCTMKLNATAEMYPVTWNEFAHIHPFSPLDQTKGYRELFRTLENYLAEITGFAAVSLQPNAGSQGEYSGLLAIRKYHEARGEGARNVCLIPKSAHGTNPASATMAGMKTVIVACDSEGNIDLADLEKKAQQHAKDLAALMVTYPSTHGVFESGIEKICDTVHKNGGQVYMDGANMNAQIGLCRPGDFGPDVCHLNLHKTFSIPHGGGGPGMGPIGVAKHLAPFLPSHPLVKMGGEKAMGAIAAAPWGSPSILPISWMYIRMLGERGMRKATEVAILNANYIAKRLNDHYPVLYKGNKDLVAHECIVDLRPIKAKSGVDVEDVAKRLMDYGFHAPTVSFPVIGTMMIEPTESESQAELDRFCDAMIAIRKEIAEVEAGKADRHKNLLKNAPHTAAQIASADWDKEHPYSRDRAVFPLPWVKANKFWPAVSRIDNVHGDRNFMGCCGPIADY